MSKSLAILIGFGVPVVIWILVFAAVRTRVFDLNSMSRVISAGRLIFALAAFMFFFCYCSTSPPSSTGWLPFTWCSLWLSLNLFLPQQWLRKQVRRTEHV